MKRLLLFLISLWFAPHLFALQAANGFCQVGGVKVTTQGILSTTTVQASYPRCSVKVYLTGTTTLAPIFDGAGHALGNPFTANTDGSWLFYAATGVGMDIVMSGGTPIAFPAPFTITDFVLGGGGGGGGVAEIIPGANVTCTPNVGGNCVGAVTVNAASGGAGNPAAPQGSVQYANLGATAFVAAPPLNTDVFGTAAAAQAAGCGTVCDLFTPANSTDGNAGWSLGTQPGKISNMWADHRGNRDSKYFTNPQPAPSFPTFSQGQAAHPENLLYTEPNPTPIAGSEQSNRVQLSQYAAPGFSNGFGGCPLFCPPAGYTSVAAWTVMNEFEDQVTFNSAGISDFRGTHCDFSGIGDHQCGLGGVFVQYAGGFVAPSDEGLYGIGSVHMATMGDWQGTLTAIVDANHIKASQFANEQKQGQGRFILDFTTVPKDAGGTPLSTTVPVDLISGPIGTTPGYITINSVTLPASTAVGTLTNDCTVPLQFGGVAIGQNSLVNGCAITVTSGTFIAGNSPVCMAHNNGNLFNIGMQMVSAPTNLSGGQQTIFATMHRSVPAGSIVFQGGGCGWGIALNGDAKSFQSLNNSVIFGSVFPIIGSEAHRMYYINYDSSQVWTTIPNAGSQWGSRDTGNSPSAKGFAFPTLTRVGGVVTGVTGSHGQQGHPGYQMLNQTEFIAVSGCTEPTMNSAGVGNFTGMPGPEPGRLVYGLPGPDNVCTNATISMADTTVGPVFLAEVYDVTNHGFGLAPFDVVDGTFAISYQPNFVVNDILDSPTHYAAAAVGLRISDEIAQPNQQNIGLWLNMQNVGSYTGQAINVNANAPSNEQWGSGGSGYPLEVLSIHGYVGNIVDSQYAPAPGSSIITMGFASPGLANSGVTNSSFRNYNVWQLNSSGGGIAQDELNWDMDSQSYTLCFNFGNCTWSMNPSGSFQSTAAKFLQPQFGINKFPSGYVPLTQLTECSPIPANGASPLCYNPIITNNAVITQSGTAGTSQYQYTLGVNDVAGWDFSPIVQTFTGNATLSGTNFNNIPCTDLPTGKTGTIFVFSNPIMFSVGTCPNSATVVHDTGARVTAFSPLPMIDGGIFDSGGFRVQGATGFYSFSDPDIFNRPFAITASISQTAAGILSVNTTATGNTLGELDAALFKQAGSVVCTAANGLCTGGVVGVSSINGTAGAFTFTGAGVSCTTTTCTFSGTGGSGVTTFNTRAGVVVPVSGDYSFSLLSGNLGNSQGPTGLTGLLKDTAGTLSVAASGTDYVIPSGSITGNSGTTSAFASTPTLCSTGNAPTGILANGNATGCAAITGGSGTVTSFAAPSGSWPTWLVPTVTSSTTTPSLAVAASAIPNSALANASITLGTTSVALGATISGATGFNAATATLATNSSAVGGVALSGLCQTGGAGCPASGTGNTTSTSLATNTIPKANGANSIINSGLTDDGTKLTYTGSGTANGFLFPEGTPISGVALSAALYPSSTTHRWMQNPNSIGALMVPGIATAGTAGHLATLAANGIDLVDGGAVPAQTFPSAGIMVSTGSAFGTSLAAPTGAIVGTTDTQTLTNKSIVATQLTGTLQAAQEPAHTGDVTNTAGSLALAVAANAVTGAKMANNTVTATQLAAQYSKGSCTEVWGGSGASFALTSGDDAISNNTCYNDSGVTRTITAVKCRSTIASNTTTVNPTFGAAGTGTTILSGAVTCGSSLAYSTSGTVSNASWTTGTGITPAMGGTLTGTSIAMIVEYTY